MKQFAITNDHKFVGIVVGQGVLCKCGQWKYPIRWNNNRRTWLCVTGLDEFSSDTWIVKRNLDLGEYKNAKESPHCNRNVSSNNVCETMRCFNANI